MSPSPRPPHAATCEDYNEDAETALPDVRKVANVAAKRSKPDMAAKPQGSSVNAHSDSGYSSRTAGTGGTGATVGSGESGPKRGRNPPPLKVNTAVEERERRPYGSEMRRESLKPDSARPKTPRSQSKPRKSEYVRHSQGTCLDCDRYGYHPPTTSAPPKSTKEVPVPVSPNRGRKPPPVASKEEQIPNATTQARPTARRSSSSYRTNSRPVSFHGGAGAPPEMMFASTYGPTVYDYGAPPSTWSNTPTFSTFPSFPPSSYPSAYVTAPITPISSIAPTMPYYEVPTNVKLPARRSSSRGPPVVRQSHPFQHERPPSPRKERRDPPPTRQHAYEDDYHRMPPPPAPQVISCSRRPSLKKSATTTSAQGLQAPRREERPPPEHSRRPSDVAAADPPVQILRRPSGRKTVSYDLDPPPARRTERPLNRRSTVYGAEGLRDLEQKQRDVEEYQQARGTHNGPFQAEPIPLSRRGSTHASARSESGSHRSRASSGKGSSTKSRADKNDITMTVHGVTLGFSGDNKDIRIKSKAHGAMQLQIDGKKARRNSMARVERIPTDGHAEPFTIRDDETGERASRKSSRSGRSAK